MANAVLLTRAEGQNAGLARRLKAAGLETVAMPMLAIHARPVSDRMRQLAMNLDRFDHVVFVSRNAVSSGMDMLEQYWPQWPVGLHWHAVGDATARLLQRRGVDPSVPAQHSSEGLLASGVFDDVDGDKILIVRGEGGRERLAQALAERGAEVTYLEVYVREAVTLAEDARQHLLALLPVVAVVYSGETLRALAANLGDVRQGLSIVVPSGRVRDEAAALGFMQVTTATGTDENAMLAAALRASALQVPN